MTDRPSISLLSPVPNLFKSLVRFWKRAGVSDKIETIIAPAADSLRKLKADSHPPFEYVFIDAGKPSYSYYVKLLLDLDMLTPDGFVLAVYGVHFVLVSLIQR